MFDFQIVSAAIFLATLLVLGMPHGAIDHYLYFAIIKKTMSVRRLTLFVFAYIFVALFFLSVWFISPWVAAWGLIFLTWYHWGQADLYYEKHRGTKLSFIFGLWRGAIPMLTPLIFNAKEYSRALNEAISFIEPNYSGIATDWINSHYVKVSVGLLLLLTGIIHWTLLRKNQTAIKQRKLKIISEDIALICLLIFLPPLVSIGLYFSFWHSRRHINLTCMKLGGNFVIEKNSVLKVNWFNFYKASLPFTLAGIIFVVAFALFRNLSSIDIYSLIGSYLIILWSLTWPHTIIYSLIDKIKKS
ncbi:MAG: Brp/Blh family beta-carotene 15,15'-dioxygenase [Verrucomicrobiota bacterium]